MSFFIDPPDAELLMLSIVPKSCRRKEESSSRWLSCPEDLENRSDRRLFRREERLLFATKENTMMQLAVRNPRPVSSMLQ